MSEFTNRQLALKLAVEHRMGGDSSSSILQRAREFADFLEDGETTPPVKKGPFRKTGGKSTG